jgi:hypothetical protein
MAASIKMTAFWDMASCNLIETDWHFRGAYCLYHQGDDFPETSVYFHETTRRHIPEGCHLHIQHFFTKWPNQESTKQMRD